MARGRRGKPGHAGAEVAVNAYSERWLRRSFPWVYPKEIEDRGRFSAGEVVLVRGADGAVLGRGLADDGWIAVRVFRHDGGPLDVAWLRATLDRAAALRDRVVDPDTTGYRLVNAENDGLPGIRIDWWSYAAVVTLDAPSIAPLVSEIAAWLVEVRGARSVYLCYRPDPRDAEHPVEQAPPGLIAGHPLHADLRVTERGLGFLVRPWDGPDVGLYADMREVRAWLEPYWGGRTVLNTFAYTGAFSVAAAFNGASEVVSVDLSEGSLERAEANFVTNELDPAEHTFLAEDVFKALDRFRRLERRFDFVILDPPSFSRSDAGVWSAKRDWPRLVAAACRVIDADGWLLLASNQGELSPRDLQGHVLDGFKRAGRHARELWRGTQAPDFPAASWFPEGRYLKVAVWAVQ